MLPTLVAPTSEVRASVQQSAAVLKALPGWEEASLAAQLLDTLAARPEWTTASLYEATNHLQTFHMQLLRESVPDFWLDGEQPQDSPVNSEGVVGVALEVAQVRANQAFVLHQTLGALETLVG